MPEPPLLLFVCSGNICRSPMAAAIAADLALRQHLPVRVASSGTMALTGDPVDTGAAMALREVGLALEDHRAAQVTKALTREATLIVGATREHARWLRTFDPAAASKVASFDELTRLGDIPDPYGAGADEYRAVRQTLVAGMPHVLAALKASLAGRSNEPPSQ